MDSEGVGSLSLVLGGGELLAAFLVARLADRIGLTRSVGIGAAAIVIAQVLLALLGWLCAVMLC
jgi:predicted MFS family arabinose efflux permease